MEARLMIVASVHLKAVLANGQAHTDREEVATIRLSAGVPVCLFT